MEQVYRLNYKEPKKSAKKDIDAKLMADAKLIEEKSKAEEDRDRMKALLESIGDAVVAIDRDWNIILWNTEATNLAGWSRDEVFGKPFREYVKFVNEDDGVENIAFIAEAMVLRQERISERNILLIGKDDKKVAVGNSASPVIDREGAVNGAIVIFRDITHEKEIDRAKTEFVSLAAHQLNTPLTAMSGYAEMLLDENVGKLNDKQREYLNEVYAATQRMIELVGAMLNVSRIEMGVFAVEPEPADILEIAKTVIVELSAKIQDKKLKVIERLDQNLPVVDVDKVLMKMIFQNLLTNAVKYTPSGGSIILVIKKEDPNFLISVSDTGYGIPKDVQSKIFTKLFRADNAREHEPSGTGLGLYIIKAVIEAVGGSIWFTSEENKGANFFVMLPLTGMKKRVGTKGLR